MQKHVLPSDKQSAFYEHLNLDIRVRFRDRNMTVLQFNAIHTAHVLTIKYHPTYTLYDTPFMTYIKSYMSQHPGVILGESL